MTVALPDEGPQRCRKSQPTARVENAEEVALLALHPDLCDEKGILKEGAFSISKMTLKDASTAEDPHDCCGHSQGLSLDRTEQAQAPRLRERCAELALRRGPNVRALGASIANVSAIRDLSLGIETQSQKPGKPLLSATEQVVFILADGVKGNETHAVLRLHPLADRAIAAKVRGMLMREFQPMDKHWTQGSADI